MTKKKYIAPQIAVVELETPTLMLMVSGETGGVGSGGGPVGDGTEDLSNRRRGTWGDLWN